jgi:leader peptidase (prepilin peptidase)/N-methyltransferase
MMAYTILVAALFGAAAGSFLNVCVFRLPREGLSVSRPKRSFCPSCGFAIPWQDNIPLWSWLRLGGRCRSCSAPISVRYLAVEGLTALLFVLVAQRFLIAEWSPAAFIAVAVLAAALVAASFIDIELRVIPDEITLPGLALAPAVLLLAPDIHAGDSWIAWLLAGATRRLEPLAASLPAFLRGWPGTAAAVAVAAAAASAAGLFGYAAYWRRFHADAPKKLRDCWLAAVLAAWAAGMATLGAIRPDLLLAPPVFAFWAGAAGMLVGSTLVLAVGVVGSWFARKPAMGFGDVKLMGVLGAFTGWVGVIAAFLIACFLGSFVGVFLWLRYRSRYLPFGPLLAAGGLAMVLFPEAFAAAVRWYLGLFR